jgi:peptidoglycan/LPS O-acetylase OafA/YrhL
MAMKISGRWQRMIVLATIYAILLITMILSSIWKWHDSTNLLLHNIFRLTLFFLVFGLLFWFGEKWKYFKITAWVVFLICCIFATIHNWQKGDPWGYIFYPIWFLWGLYSLKEEIVKHMTHNDTKETSNELLSGSEK